MRAELFPQQDIRIEHSRLAPMSFCGGRRAIPLQRPLALALRAVSIAVTVVGDLYVRAHLAARSMAAKNGRHDLEWPRLT